MNLTQAEAIASLYTELINSIDKTKLDVPVPTFRKDNKFTLDEIYLTDGQLRLDWSRYEGCGSYDRETTYQSLDQLFED